MDPADPDTLKKAISNQGVRLGQHQDMLQELQDSLRQLHVQVTHLTDQLTSRLPPQPSGPVPSVNPVPIPPPVSPKEPYVPPPEPYAGDSGNCRGFLLRCSLVFDQQPLSYPSDRSKIAYVINLLRGRAARWATAIWDQQSPSLSSYHNFSEELRRVFDHPIQGQEAAKRLFSLSQGSQSAADFSIEFRIAASESGWGEQELKGVFVRSLSEQLKDELASRDEPSSLEDLISLVIRLDNRLRERRRERRQEALSFPRVKALPLGSIAPASQSSAPVQPEASPEEPMQLGRTHLHPEELQRRRNHKLCIYCGQAGHFIASCPLRLNGRAHQ